jgi:tripartite-type tricarboxylate transporter receptor subunit TctC
MPLKTIKAIAVSMSIGCVLSNLGYAASPNNTWAPSKPIRFIVGFPPGGATDLVARILQPHLTSSLGNTVVVDNRPGANGVISMQVLARSETDGHTIAISHIGSLIVSPTIQKVGYDPMKDFSAVGMLVQYLCMYISKLCCTYRTVPYRSRYMRILHTGTYIYCTYMYLYTARFEIIVPLSISQK